MRWPPSWSASSGRCERRFPRWLSSTIRTAWRNTAFLGVGQNRSLFFVHFHRQVSAQHKDIVFLIDRRGVRHIDSKPLPQGQITHTGMEIYFDLAAIALHHHSLGPAAEEGRLHFRAADFCRKRGRRRCPFSERQGEGLSQSADLERLTLILHGLYT